MLTPAQLLSMRTHLALSLPDSCSITTTTTTHTSGMSSSSSSTAVSVACRVSPVSASGQDAQHGSRVVESADWLLTLPHGTSIDVEDTVAHGGHVYTVTAVDADRSYAIAVRATMRRRA